MILDSLDVHQQTDQQKQHQQQQQQQQQQSQQRGYKRLISKNGEEKVHYINTALMLGHYIHDLANTLINAQWKWILFALSFSFIFTWLIFGYLWMLIAISNGDLENGIIDPCLSGIESFAGYLLFSIETQTTIGYGNRVINDNCPEAVFLLCVQLLTGICICGIVVSIVYERISSGPRQLLPKTSFSKYAIICQRDGQYCLIFRIRDCTGRYQCRNGIKAFLLQYRGDEYYLKSLKLQPLGLLIWPIEVVHIIDNSSPFWNLSANDLIQKRFEIIVAMEGTSITTSTPSRTTTSYLSKEILWGHTFQPCVKYEHNCYIVDHKLFNSIKETLMPLCSAQRLYEIIQDIKNIQRDELGEDNLSFHTNMDFDESGDDVDDDDDDDDDNNNHYHNDNDDDIESHNQFQLQNQQLMFDSAVQASVIVHATTQSTNFNNNNDQNDGTFEKLLTSLEEFVQQNNNTK